MRRERRLIWVEDRYQLLGCDGIDRYYGRAKGDVYFVYRKRGDSARREILQAVDGERDWFWDSVSNRLVAHEMIQVTDSEPLIDQPVEHVLRGYRNSKRIENLTEVSVDGSRAPMQSTEIRLDSGATAILLSSSRLPGVDPTRDWLISLHGGPESLEGTEIRYGGLYRELLRKGWGIAILNYRGSTGLEKPDTISWQTSIAEDFDSLISHRLFGPQSELSVSLLGASFGGALAILLSQSRTGVKQTLLISPLLDLAHQRDRGGIDFKDWFDSRFSVVDFQSISFGGLSRGILDSNSRVGLIFGYRDEVLGHEMFLRLAKVLRSQKNHAIHAYEGPHQPVAYRDVDFQLTQSFLFLTESIDAVCQSAIPD